MKHRVDIESNMGLLQRELLRRAYNKRDDVNVDRLSRTLVDHPKYGSFARDVLIRSMWRRGRWKDVVDLCRQWPESDMHSLAERAIRHLERKHPPKKSYPSERPPEGLGRVDWDAANLHGMWHQVEQRLWFRHPWGWCHWDMPAGWSLESTHPALIELAADVLLRPWVKEVMAPLTKGRKQGSRLGLAWSCGVDSTAAMLLLNDSTVLAYHERDVPSMLDHRNAMHLIMKVQSLGRDVIVIRSDHELIRTNDDKMIGFSTDYASGVHLILLADWLELAGVAFGVPIDNTWLQKGRRFRDFSQSNHWIAWKARFVEAGLDLVLPINHISEAGALRIVQASALASDVNSCMRGDGRRGCGRCWKCFHKNGPMGRPFDVSSHEISTFLSQRPLRTAQHALWALKNLGLEDLVPDLQPLLKEDLGWWESAFEPGFELIPDPWRAEVESRTRALLDVRGPDSPLVKVNLFAD